MLNQRTAEWYMTGTVQRMLDSLRLCGYGSGVDATHETLSLHAIGPLPVATARADYDAAYKAARKTADDTRKLKIGPSAAFGFESYGDGRGTASVVFLAGHWTGSVAIDAPALTGDAGIDEMARLVQRQIWPRWTRHHS